MCLVNDLLSVQLIKALVPSDPLDSSNILLEVVAGRTTGGTKGSAQLLSLPRTASSMFFLSPVHVVSGDICQQFTREMFDMYQGFAWYKNWDFEVLNYTPAEYGKSYVTTVPVVFKSMRDVQKEHTRRKWKKTLFLPLTVIQSHQINHVCCFQQLLLLFSCRVYTNWLVSLRWFASCSGENSWWECVQTPEAWRRNSPGAEDPWGGPLLQDAAYPHGDHDSHHPSSASGGTRNTHLLTTCLFIISFKSEPHYFCFLCSSLVWCPHRSKGSSHRYLQISRCWRSKCEHNRQRSARRSSSHW